MKKKSVNQHFNLTQRLNQVWKSGGVEKFRERCTQKIVASPQGEGEN